MKKLLVILSVFLMVSVSYGANVDLKIDGTQYTCTPSGSPPVTPPVTTYTVTVAVINPAGGTVSPTSVSGIAYGGQAAFNVSINTGYTASVSMGNLLNGVWTITNIVSNLIASVTFIQSPVACQSDDIKEPVSRIGIGSGTYCIPGNRPALLVQAVGTTNETDAWLTWTFPDGRVFPVDPQNGRLIGTGTASVSLRLRSQSAPSPNIPDQYIPQGRHRLTVTGTASGFMDVLW